MAGKLSISRAWDESREIVAREGRLITSVALALIVLPGTIVGLVAPPMTLTGEEPPAWAGALGLLVGLITIAGQIAITRLALGPETSVRDAINHGARRLFPAFGAALLFAIIASLVLLPLFMVLVGTENLKSMATAPSPQVGMAVLLVLVLALLIGVKLQMIVPVATAEEGGPWRILKRSWQMTNGHYWRLLAFLMLCMVVLVVVVLFVGQMTVGVLIKGMFGDVDALSIGALIAALIGSAIQAVFAALLAIMLARIYAQLAGGEAEASVPSSGS